MLEKIIVTPKRTITIHLKDNNEPVEVALDEWRTNR